MRKLWFYLNIVYNLFFVDYCRLLLKKLLSGVWSRCKNLVGDWIDIFPIWKIACVIHVGKVKIVENTGRKKYMSRALWATLQLVHFTNYFEQNAFFILFIMFFKYLQHPEPSIYYETIMKCFSIPIFPFSQYRKINRVTEKS